MDTPFGPEHRARSQNGLYLNRLGPVPGKLVTIDFYASLSPVKSGTNSAGY